MSRDFTYHKYRALCEAFCLQGYSICTVADYLSNHPSESKIVVLRHDVDRRLQHAVRMAIIESEFGIRSTYYFRYNKEVFHPAYIQRIADMGHEIGYHYETIDKAKGDSKTAIKIFADELAKFREIAEVNTICMHGNPLTKWINRDLWKEYNFSDFGITGEAFISVKDIPYFSDTGRTWADKYKMKDYLPSAGPNNGGQTAKHVACSTDDLIHILSSGHVRSAYVLAHPERWNERLSSWSMSLVADTITNLCKIMISFRNKKCVKVM